jgi:DNA processing protein
MGPHESAAETADASRTDSAARAATPLAAPQSPPVDPEAQRLLAALGHSPTTLEILATRTEMEDAALQTTLLQLELAGQVSVLPGGRFMRTSHG